MHIVGKDGSGDSSYHIFYTVTWLLLSSRGLTLANKMWRKWLPSLGFQKPSSSFSLSETWTFPVKKPGLASLRQWGQWKRCSQQQVRKVLVEPIHACSRMSDPRREGSNAKLSQSNCQPKDLLWSVNRVVWLSWLEHPPKHQKVAGFILLGAPAQGAGSIPGQGIWMFSLKKKFFFPK